MIDVSYSAEATGSKIIAAEIIPANRNAMEEPYQATLNATFEDGTVCINVLSWYDDELTFNESEFIGLTREQVQDLWFEKDQVFITTP